MPSGNTTIKSRVNPSKFMGAAHAAGSELEERVGNNERKITLIKNIINYKDSLLPIPNPEEGDGDSTSNLNIAGRLDNIGEALGVIGGLFKLQLSSLQDKDAKDRKDEAEQDKKAREKELEAGKKATKPKGKSLMPKPVLGFFDTLKKFFLNVAFGAVTLKLIKWFKDPANRDKIQSWVTWIRDNAKAIFVTLGALVALDIAFKFIGFLGTLKIVGALLLSPKFLALMAVIGGAIAIDDFRKQDFRLNENVLNQKVEQKEKVLGRKLTAEEINDISLSKDVDLKLGGDRDLTAGAGLLGSPGGSPGGVASELYFGSLLGEWIMRKQAAKTFGKKDDLNSEFADGGRPPVGEVVSVGEKGRELFVADTSGTVISNDKTEHVFDGGAILVAKSSALEKISNTSSSISQKVNNRHGSSKIIDLRGGQQQGSTPTAGNITTGNQIEGVSSVFLGDLLVKAAQVQLGVVG